VQTIRSGFSIQVRDANADIRSCFLFNH